MSIAPIKWDTHINYPGMVRVPAIGDGSCFFHAFVNSFFIPYKTQKYEGKPIDRRKLVRNLRKDLSVKLGERVDPNDPNSPTYYDTLSRGKLSEWSKELPQYSLSHMQRELDSSGPVGNHYNEFLSNLFDKDIYLLDDRKKDVYMTGNDMEMLYKNRNSVVILVRPGHYDLVGIKEAGEIYTLFKHDHPFITMIRRRMEGLLPTNV